MRPLLVLVGLIVAIAAPQTVVGESAPETKTC
jgi:hypothetical protein